MIGKGCTRRGFRFERRLQLLFWSLECLCNRRFPTHSGASCGGGCACRLTDTRLSRPGWIILCNCGQTSAVSCAEYRMVFILFILLPNFRILLLIILPIPGCGRKCILCHNYRLLLLEIMRILGHRTLRLGLLCIRCLLEVFVISIYLPINIESFVELQHILLVELVK